MKKSFHSLVVLLANFPSRYVEDASLHIPALAHRVDLPRRVWSALLSRNTSGIKNKKSASGVVISMSAKMTNIDPFSSLTLHIDTV